MHSPQSAFHCVAFRPRRDKRSSLKDVKWPACQVTDAAQLCEHTLPTEHMQTEDLVLGSLRAEYAEKHCEVLGWLHEATLLLVKYT